MDDGDREKRAQGLQDETHPFGEIDLRSADPRCAGAALPAKSATTVGITTIRSKSFAWSRARPIGTLNCFLNNEVVHRIATEFSPRRWDQESTSTVRATA